MEFILDVHCHTVLSGHAHSTLYENASYASEIGLRFIGIADHGPGMQGGAHKYNFTNLWSMPDVICGVRVFKGVEANIMNIDGRLDLSDKLLGRMDFVIASLHRGIITPTEKKDHTRAIISAMENPNVHIIGHPGDKWFEIDVEAVVKAAARTRTIIEINNQSLNPGSHRFQGNEIFVELLMACKECGVPVLASSDAHFCTNIGNFEQAKALIQKVGLAENEVLNTCADRFLAAVGRKKGDRAFAGV